MAACVKFTVVDNSQIIWCLLSYSKSDICCTTYLFLFFDFDLLIHFSVVSLSSVPSTFFLVCVCEQNGLYRYSVFRLRDLQSIDSRWCIAYGHIPMCNMITCCTVIIYLYLVDSRCSALCSNVAPPSLNSTLIYSILQLILCMLIWLQWAEMCKEFKCAQIIQISLIMKWLWWCWRFIILL